jgi:ABC-type bacteriocin/lantibiotic exporter with double-glycine peptidase domain
MYSKFMGTYLSEIIFLLGRDIVKIPLLIICFLIIAILDVLGISLIVPFVSLIVAPEILQRPEFKLLHDYIGIDGDTASLVFFLSLALGLTFLLKAVGAILIHWMVVKFTNNQMVRLRSHLMRSYQSLPYDKYIQRNSSEYIFAMQSLTSIFAGRVLLPGLRAISDGIVCCGILILLAVASGVILAYLAAMLAVSLLVYDRFFKNKLIAYGERKNASATKMLCRLNEGIQGLKEIRIVNAENYFYRGLVENAEIFSKNESRSQAISIAPRYLLELLIVGFLIGLVLVTASSEGELQKLIPVLTMFSFAALRLMPSVNSVLTNVLALRANRNAVALLYKDLRDLEVVSHLTSHPVDSDRDDEPFRELELRDISYTYPTAKQPALRNISLIIKAGQSVGIIGVSGAGKTTILDVLLGLLEPSTGEVLFNGRALSATRSDLMKNIAYLPQEIFLADSSLRENVALGLMPNEIDESLLIQSLEMARLSDLIIELPQGLDTVIGERGVRLSGGQRQRISLARAFYHRRSVLVFDEATSALDDATESEVVTEIHQLKRRKTLIMIAHRLSTLKHCDIIVKLDKGRIVDVGSFDAIVGVANNV